MKPTIRKIKDIRGRKVRGYEASLGALTSAHCDTSKAAIEDLEYLTIKAIDRLANGPTIARWQGHQLVVYPTLAGWGYWLDTFSSTKYGCDVGDKDPIEAYNRAVYHLAQNIWTADTDDHELLAAVPDVAKRAELAGWIAFQRAYLSIKAMGQTAENDLHAAACAQGTVYAREHFASYLHAAHRQAV